jgi:hypothetical protein
VRIGGFRQSLIIPMLLRERSNPSRSSNSAQKDGRIRGGIHTPELDRSRHAPVRFGRRVIVVVVVIVVYADTSRNSLAFRLFNIEPMSWVQLRAESCIS